jgi:ribonuclease J
MKQQTTAATGRGVALRAQRQKQEQASRIVQQYAAVPSAVSEASSPPNPQALKLTFLGGLNEIGEKNMAILEWQDDALVIDCGLYLGIELPGINYEINDPTYLLSIKHKIRGYVITHGHLDHIGGLKHVVPLVPAPIYGSRFTLGIVQKTFEDATIDNGVFFTPTLEIMNMDAHERCKVGPFFIELIRVTHSLPEPAAICIDTPVGRIIATGDFRLDPEPLDQLPTDRRRLEVLGKEGVLLLLSESSYADCEGRTPTEHTLQPSFHDLISQAEGRVFVSVFSSNINRIQMLINAAVAAGRRVALDGRSMLAYAEIAVTQGILKVPKGAIVAMKQCADVPDNQLLVMCTGGQGEPRAALQRMSEGTHKQIQLHAGDTVAISSSPIPGNEIRYDQISDNLTKLGVHLYRHPTHILDGCGPLHVSGHARRDELHEMLTLTNPKFFIPVHGGALRRSYHAGVAKAAGYASNAIFLPNNGDSLLITANSVRFHGQVPHGGLLVDQNGKVASSVVVKDRLLLAEEGILTAVLTIDKKTGQLLISPDIISRGFVHLRDNEELMQDLRAELRRATQQRFGRLDLDRFKVEIREHVTRFLFEKTGQSPLVIAVVNVINKQQANTIARTKKSAVQEQKRFQAMREQLLTQ